MDITLYKTTNPKVSCTFPLADWVLIDDLCTYARSHFEATDPETQERLLTALDRIQEALNDVFVPPDAGLTPAQRALLQAAPPSREVH